MKLRATKYELWNALSMCPDKEKTEAIKELERKLNDTMAKGYNVVIDIREE